MLYLRIKIGVVIMTSRLCVISGFKSHKVDWIDWLLLRLIVLLMMLV